MLFTSNIFLFAFLPMVLVGYFVIFRWSHSLRGRNAFLLAASLLFYAWVELRFTIILMASILLNWAFALLIEKTKHKKSAQKSLLALAALQNLAILMAFKYLPAALRGVGALSGVSFGRFERIALPVGISFVTFQALSYLIDVYRGEPASRSLPELALYLAFFPQLIAGPILRHGRIAPQIKQRGVDLAGFEQGLRRFMVGFCKKALLANQLAYTAAAAFPDENRTTVQAWVGIAAAVLEVYYDFSGYSDMAIGLGRLFGFSFPENFRYPFVSASFKEFWSRWHISLGAWFRDYVYYPLGGNRKGARRTALNLFIVWTLTGLWHGAGWNYLLWGVCLFAGVASEKFLGWHKKRSWHAHITTILAFLLSCVFLHAQNLALAFSYYKSLFALGLGPLAAPADWFRLTNHWAVYAAALLCAVPFAPWLSKKLEARRWAAPAGTALLLLAFLLAVSVTIQGNERPFVYFQF